MAFGVGLILGSVVWCVAFGGVFVIWFVVTPYVAVWCVQGLHPLQVAMSFLVLCALVVGLLAFWGGGGERLLFLIFGTTSPIHEDGLHHGVGLHLSPTPPLP